MQTKQYKQHRKPADVVCKSSEPWILAEVVYTKETKMGYNTEAVNRKP